MQPGVCHQALVLELADGGAGPGGGQDAAGCVDDVGEGEKDSVVVSDRAEYGVLAGAGVGDGVGRPLGRDRVSGAHRTAFFGMNSASSSHAAISFSR